MYQEYIFSRDLARGVDARQSIEGVTIDENGVIYLVAEDSGTGNSRLFVVEPVPEPGTWALMLSGLAILAWSARRRRA